MSMTDSERAAFLAASLVCETPEEMWRACSAWKDSCKKADLIDKELRITITGAAGSGKTIVACALATFLRGKGSVVNLKDPDVNYMRDINEKSLLLDATASRTMVCIETVNAVRSKA